MKCDFCNKEWFDGDNHLYEKYLIHKIIIHGNELN